MNQIPAQFPIQNNSSLIPEQFRYFAVDFTRDQCPELRQMGCTDLISVYSPAGWVIRRRGDVERRHIDLYMVQTGQLQLFEPLKSWQVGPGQIMLVPSWIDYEMRVVEESHHLYIRFDAIDYFPNVKEIETRESLACSIAEQIFEQMLHPRPMLADENKYRNLLLGTLAIIFNREIIPQNESGSTKLSQKVRHYLQTASKINFNVSEIAKKFHMSLTAFRTFCLNNYGKSPSHFINEIRMVRARALLNYSDMSIPEIAEHLGFSDRFVFSKAFQRNCRITPGEFRQKGSRNS